MAVLEKITSTNDKKHRPFNKDKFSFEENLLQETLSIHSKQDLINAIAKMDTSLPDVISINNNTRHHITGWGEINKNTFFYIDDKTEISITDLYWYFINDPVFTNISKGYSDTLCIAFRDKEHTQPVYSFVLTERNHR